MKRTLNASLKHLNSFAVEANARQLLELETEHDLQVFTTEFRFNPTRDLILGSGSNMLFAGDIDGTVVLNRIPGKSIIADSSNGVLIEACGGENWHQLVLWSLDQGLSGIENLSLIPGLAGAAPIQNIGAYGVELADSLDSVQVLDLENGVLCEFSHKDCHFAYRDSRFKSTDAGKYLITRIRLCLQREFEANLGYAGLTEELQEMGIDVPTAYQVSQAVIRIRQRKLPDPHFIGNAGSFFKNPVVSRATAGLLEREFHGLPLYPISQDETKLSAAWLIEQCGWKGRSMGGAAVSDQHALVLVNQDNATGSEILALADAIGQSVQDRFDIKLQP
ncbi:MAG: UDP-N-acetylmuramate dehydrogenase, partial [Gammaproteobacteria bacterium]|nr:UDP-N-acetylmuramate dehydrogenase [Gammaproteobacteria bacterium]